MSLDNKLEEMKEEAIEMAEYYYKCFSNAISSVMGVAQIYLKNPDKQELEIPYDSIEKIEDFYDQIPFDKLNGKEQFYPLFVIKRLLPKFRNEIDEFSKEKSQHSLNLLRRSACTICDVGHLYGISFENLIRKIRTYPEAKDFNIRITDDKGKIWDSDEYFLLM